MVVIMKIDIVSMMIMVMYRMDRHCYSNDGHFFILVTRVIVIPKRALKKSFGNQDKKEAKGCNT